MPIWALVYLALLGYSGVQCVVSAVKRQRPVWFAMLDVITTICWIVLVIAFYRASVAGALGRVAIGLFAIALLWTLASAPFEVRRIQPDPQLSERANAAADWVIVGISVLFVVPAVTIGALVVRRLL